MLRQKSGSIVNISTTLVDQPIAGIGAAVQIMLKGALTAVTRALAIEYATEGIRVNTIAPGVIDTPMHKPETHDFLKGLHPVGRIGEVKAASTISLTSPILPTGCRPFMKACGSGLCMGGWLTPGVRACAGTEAGIRVTDHTRGAQNSR